MKSKTSNFNTKAVHGYSIIDPAYESVMPPIYQTTTYKQSSPGNHKGFEYARISNPTRSILENSIASLEEGDYGISFASGVAAIDAVLKLLKPGDEVIAVKDIYGGSYRLFTKIFEDFGIVFHFIDMQDLSNIDNFLNDKTRLVWLETPSNPLMKIIDLKAVASKVKNSDILVAVDNTFASPYLQQPLKLGADIVMHSASKYLGGHSDVIMGALVVRDKELADRLYFIQKSSGAIPGPQDCYLVIRGMKTLHVRMQRHCENTREIALFLRNHQAVDQVYWPGFKDHPNHEVASSQMNDYGSVISFTTKRGTKESADEILNSVQLFTLAESLGGVESLIGHPATMSHASIPKKEREKNGIVDSLIRLSVGIEDVQDLINDLDKALSKLI